MQGLLIFIKKKNYYFGYMEENGSKRDKSTRREHRGYFRSLSKSCTGLDWATALEMERCS